MPRPKKNQEVQTSLLPEGQAETTVQDQELPPGLTVVVEFMNIKAQNLKPKFEVDDNGHIYAEVKFKAMLNHCSEMGRVGNLMAIKNGALFVVIGTHQAAMDFYYDENNNQFQIITKEDKPQPEPDGSGQAQEATDPQPEEPAAVGETGQSEGQAPPEGTGRRPRKPRKSKNAKPEGNAQAQESAPEPQPEENNQSEDQSQEITPDSDEMLKKAGYEQKGLLQIDKRINSPFLYEPGTYIEPGKYIPYVSDTGVVRVRAVDGKWLVVSSHDYTWIKEPGR